MTVDGFPLIHNPSQNIGTYFTKISLFIPHTGVPFELKRRVVFAIFMPSCGSCKVPLQPAEDSLKCDKCNKNHHWICTNLDSYKIKLHKKNPYKPWRCQNCTDKYCIDCNKTFPKECQDSICCDKCSFWFQVKSSQVNFF